MERDVTQIAGRAYQIGFEYERTYRGCSQCVVAAVYDALGIENDAVFKAATGLAGGGGLLGDTGCGAYVGGVLVLSSLIGRERADFKDERGVRFQTHAMVRKFHGRFIGRYGSVICRDIQARVMGRPFYLADPDDFKKFDEAGGHSSKCPEVVGMAARWLVELLVAEGVIDAAGGEAMGEVLRRV